ncbi:hypothetical protein PO909_003528 [Leuciscus waleckii]
MEREIDRRIGAASAVMRSMYRSVVVKKELSRKVMSIYRSIYVPTLTHGHELWVMTERTRSRIQAAEMSFLRRVAGRSLRDRKFGTILGIISGCRRAMAFCTDYRKVNSVTVPDCFPLPRMEDSVDNLGSARYVSKLDLLKGYWQVPLTARASDISAFVTPDNFLQYSVMAFGMRNAPATFQRLINIVLAGVPKCNAYLDDLVIYSVDWSEHVSSLRTVFEHLEKASLTLNLAKCEFGQATITYLGKEVGQGQVRPLEAKVTAITEFPAPTIQRELRRFLGMAGYYRGFCKNFSTVAHPLTSLLSPSRPSYGLMNVSMLLTRSKFFCVMPLF